MWASLCNFLYNKLFYKPEVKSPPRSNSSAIDPAYGKRLKLSQPDYDPNGLFSKIQPPQRFSMQARSNLASNDDEDDCCVIAELPRRKTAGSSSTTVLRYDNAFIERSSTKSDLFSPVTLRPSVIKRRDEVKVVEVVKPKEKPERDLLTRIPNKKPKFFNNQRVFLTDSQIEDSKIFYKLHVKNKINSLQQSYRLKEKFQYLRLLQRYTSHNFLSGASLKPHHVKKKTVPKEIPLIDLTKDKTSKGNTRSKRKSPIKKRKSADPDVKFIRELPAVRSFEDIIKIAPIEPEDDIQEVLIIDAEEAPEVLNLKDADQDSVTVIDDDDETISYSESLEEKMRKFVKITSTPSKRKMVNFAEVVYLPELTPSQEEKVDEALDIVLSSQAKMVVGFGLTITKHDLRTLAGNNWLNDEVINFYMHLIMDRSETTKSLPKVYAFNTFFFPKLVSSGYGSLRRWTNKVDIFSYDMVLVPVHLNLHWSLAVIDFRYKSIKYYDSMGEGNNRCLKFLLSYLKDECLDKKGEELALREWETGHVREVPYQMNGADCGVFACVFAEYLARDSGFWFNQDHMSYFRKKMVLEILEKRLIT